MSNKRKRSKKPQGEYNNTQDRSPDYRSNHKFEGREVIKGISNKRPNSKQTSSRSSSVRKEGALNDPSWYTNNGRLVLDAGRLSFNDPLGTVYPDGYLHSEAFPGLLGIKVVIGPGMCQDASDPMNVAMQAVYSYIRHQNSGHSNYDPVDLMKFFYAVDSAYAYHAWMCRLYGLALNYSQTNQYVNDALIRINKVNPDNLKQRLSDFRSYINTYTAKLLNLCVPNVFPLFKRHQWMFSNVYTDSPNPKAQMYEFVPQGFWIYDEESEPARLVFENFDTWFTGSYDNDTLGDSLATIKTLGDKIMGKVFFSEDVGIMSGDVLKAYGRENLLVAGVVTDDYSVTPVYNMEVLTQIHNLTALGTFKSATISENTSTGMLTYEPKFLKHSSLNGVTCTSAVSITSTLLDLPISDPTPEDVLVATRLKASFDYLSASSELVPSCYGTELVSQLVLCTKKRPDSTNYGGYGYSFGLLMTDGVYDADPTTTTFDSFLVGIDRYTKFDMFPLVSISGSEDKLAVLGDTDTFTKVDYGTLKKLHECATLSEWNVPILGNI